MTATSCDCADLLKAAAAVELAAADKARRAGPKMRDHADLLHRRYRALGWAAGALRDIHHGRSPPPGDPEQTDSPIP